MREQMERIQHAKILFDAARCRMLDRKTTEEVATIWARLWSEFGEDVLQVALDCQPIKAVEMDSGATLILIDGITYKCEHAHGTRLAEIQWRLTKLDGDAYFACRLANGTLQCDCADWQFRVADATGAQVTHCKHLRALASLGLI